MSFTTRLMCLTIIAIAPGIGSLIESNFTITSFIMSTIALLMIAAEIFNRIAQGNQN
jgi:hypothetical protein